MTKTVKSFPYFSKNLPFELQKLVLPYSDPVKIRAEPDFYGASRIISKSLGMKSVPQSFSSWSHGAPITRLKFPEQVVWNNNWLKFRLVANSEVKSFLESKGVEKLHAIGLPIIYVDNQHVIRRKDSVLLMLAHSLSYVKLERSFQQAIDFACELMRNGKYVCFCVHADCFVQSEITSLLDKNNIDWFVGASVSDTNSLARMRNIFEYFETVGSDAYGSNFLYAQLFGSKFFFMKPYFEYKLESFKNDPNWVNKKEVFVYSLNEYSEKVVKARYPRYFDGYENAFCNQEMAKIACGVPDKRQPEEVAALLGWRVKDKILCPMPYYGSKVINKIKTVIKGI